MKNFTKKEKEYLLETMMPKLVAIEDILLDGELLEGTDLRPVYEERRELLIEIIAKVKASDNA